MSQTLKALIAVNPLWHLLLPGSASVSAKHLKSLDLRKSWAVFFTNHSQSMVLGFQHTSTQPNMLTTMYLACAARERDSGAVSAEVNITCSQAVTCECMASWDHMSSTCRLQKLYHISSSLAAAMITAASKLFHGHKPALVHQIINIQQPSPGHSFWHCTVQVLGRKPHTPQRDCLCSAS